MRKPRPEEADYYGRDDTAEAAAADAVAVGRAGNRALAGTADRRGSRAVEDSSSLAAADTRTAGLGVVLATMDNVAQPREEGAVRLGSTGTSCTSWGARG